MTYTVGSLFSGIGGIDLAFVRAGFDVIFQVEIEPFCQQVLAKHAAQYWPNAKVYNDVKTVGMHNLPYADVLVGGFPCVDISVAGKQAGIKEGNRSGLWFEFARIIGELRPRVVLLENVPNITRLGGLDVVGQLTTLGYDAEWAVIPASAVGTPHRRERWWCVGVGHAHTHRRYGSNTVQQSPSNIERDNSTFERQGRAELHASVAGGEDECRTLVGDSTSVRRERHPQIAGSLDQSKDEGRVRKSEGTSDAVGVAHSVSSEGFRPVWEQVASARYRQAQSESAGNGTSSQRAAQSIMGRAVDGLSRQLDTSRWPARLGEAQYQWEAPRVAAGIANRRERIRALGNSVVPQVVQPIAEAIRVVLEEQDHAAMQA